VGLHASVALGLIYKVNLDVTALKFKPFFKHNSKIKKIIQRGRTRELAVTAVNT